MLPRYEMPNHSEKLGFFNSLAPDSVLRVVGSMY
jgi:hypothetical protein